MRNFCVKTGQKIELRYSSNETEAVKLAIANLEHDLKAVLSKIDFVKRELNEAETRIPSIQIRTLSEDEAREANFHKEEYRLEVKKGTLYITGADRRGSIYGIYTFCEWMGVSPWYFFADVPIKKKTELVLEEGYFCKDFPSVEYRGIFINDEEELEAWVQTYLKEPTIGVKCYEKIFELLLRLKANYIWPAMHVNSFNFTPENGKLADRMGIVVGTSHCDMLMRSNNREWKPWIEKKGYLDASYDYSIPGKNREILKEYWKESVEQNRHYEVCYTLGMRGIHDSGFETQKLKGKSEEEIRAAKVELLEQIITDQRQILADTLGRETMMTFIPYKEVLELYDNGLNVPEDMTLVWANDNYGYIRRYPGEKEKKRSGGNGIYYHNSYWSPPSMSYVFLCSIPLAHTRYELQKAWNEGIRKLWVLNCGAMKPLEQEITFFLKLAWEIGKEGTLTENVEAFVEDWMNRMFSGKIGKQVSALLNDFSQLTNVRKIENMDYDAFSQTAYGDEAVIRIHEYERLFQEGNTLYENLPEEEKAAFFQLVLMRIHAAYFTNLSWYYGDRSTLMYDRGNMQAAALYAEKAREAEQARSQMLHYYNHVMCDGKWNGILNPEAFPPPRAAMMPLCTPPLAIKGKPNMRVDVWNEEKDLCFVTSGEKWIEIGNTGNGTFEVVLQAPEWVILSETKAVVETEKRILVSVCDVSENRHGEIVIKNISDGAVTQIPVRCRKKECDCVSEEDGIVRLEGTSACTQSKDFRVIKRLGRMRGDLIEVCVQKEMPDRESKPLGYLFEVCSEGEFLLEIHRFPSLNSVGKIRIGVSVDQGEIQIVESESTDEWRGTWKKNVLNNVDCLYLKLPAMKCGVHKLYLWGIDKYFAFSRLIIYTKQRNKNNLAGVKGVQLLPLKWEVQSWCDQFYGTYMQLPRPTFYAAKKNDKDTVAVTIKTVQAEIYAPKIKSEWYLERGSHCFAEENGRIAIDAACALAQSQYAWTDSGIPEKKIWRHCSSESFGQSGLAMYIRTRELKWDAAVAPSLNYRIACEGGSYTLWMLSKFNVREESFFAVGIDDKSLTKDEIWGNGCLWRYEAEQIYCWVPITRLTLKAGEHVLHVYALASGMRYDRFYLTKGNDLPPVDAGWRNTM